MDEGWEIAASIKHLTSGFLEGPFKSRLVLGVEMVLSLAARRADGTQQGKDGGFLS